MPLRPGPPRRTVSGLSSGPVLGPPSASGYETPMDETGFPFPSPGSAPMSAPAQPLSQSLSQSQSQSQSHANGRAAAAAAIPGSGAGVASRAGATAADADLVAAGRRRARSEHARAEPGPGFVSVGEGGNVNVNVNVNGYADAGVGVGVGVGVDAGGGGFGMRAGGDGPLGPLARRRRESAANGQGGSMSEGTGAPAPACAPHRPRKVGLRDRIACFQWTWFTMTMATGGIANVFYSIPYKSDWLTGIGLTFFFLNICLFTLNCLLISLRFYWRPGSFVDSFTDQFESLFISAIIVSAATILITTTQYGTPRTGPWLLAVLEALFWVYVGVSTIVSAGLYLTLWSTQKFPIHTMTPVWVFPAYPLLLTAPFGANLVGAASNAGRLRGINAAPVALTAVTVQGTGFLISFMVCAAFLYRLMTQKLPRDHQRPGVFISIGPSGFTCAGIVQLGSLAPAIFPDNFLGTQYGADILRLLAYMIGLWLWGLSIWFFLVSVGSLWKYLRPENKAKLRFQMTWFSFVFPNTALVTATEALGSAFDSSGLKIFGCVLSVCLVMVWIVVFTKMLRCLWRKELLWPKDED